MAVSWYVEKSGKRSGPFSTAQLKEMAASGRLQPGDMVFRDGLDRPVPASKVKGLFGNGDESPPAAPQVPATPPARPKAGVHVQNKLAERPARPQPPATEPGEAGTAPNAGKRKLLGVAGLVAGVVLFTCCGGAALVGLLGKGKNDSAHQGKGEQDKGEQDKGDTKAAQDGTGGSKASQVRILETPMASLNTRFKVEEMLFSPDNRFLLVHGRNLWHLPSRKEWPLPDAKRGFPCGAFSPDGKFFACISSGTDLMVFRLGEDKAEPAVTHPISAPTFADTVMKSDFQWTRILWSSDGGTVAAVSNLTAAVVGNVHGERTETIIRHPAFKAPVRGSDVIDYAVGQRFKIRSAALTPDGKKLALAFQEGGISAFEVPGGREVAPLSFPPSITKWQFQEVAFSSDGKVLATVREQTSGRAGGEFHTSRKWTTFWDTDGWKEKYKLGPKADDRPNQDSSPRFLGFLGQQPKFAMGSNDGGYVVRTYDASTGTQAGEVRPVPKQITHFRTVISADGQTVMFQRGNGPVQLWSLTSGEMVAAHLLPPPQTSSRYEAISADGKFLATGHPDGLVVIWAVSAGREGSVKEVVEVAQVTTGR